MTLGPLEDERAPPKIKVYKDSKGQYVKIRRGKKLVKLYKPATTDIKSFLLEVGKKYNLKKAALKAPRRKREVKIKEFQRVPGVKDPVWPKRADLLDELRDPAAIRGEQKTYYTEILKRMGKTIPEEDEAKQRKEELKAKKELQEEQKQFFANVGAPLGVFLNRPPPAPPNIVVNAAQPLEDPARQRERIMAGLPTINLYGEEVPYNPSQEPMARRLRQRQRDAQQGLQELDRLKEQRHEDRVRRERERAAAAEERERAAAAAAEAKAANIAEEIKANQRSVIYHKLGEDTKNYKWAKIFPLVQKYPDLMAEFGNPKNKDELKANRLIPNVLGRLYAAGDETIRKVVDKKLEEQKAHIEALAQQERTRLAAVADAARERAGEYKRMIDTMGYDIIGDRGLEPPQRRFSEPRDQRPPTQRRPSADLPGEGHLADVDMDILTAAPDITFHGELGAERLVPQGGPAAAVGRQQEIKYDAHGNVIPPADQVGAGAGVSSIDLVEMMKRHKPVFKGVYAKDQLAKIPINPLSDNAWIMNTQNASQPGKHWQAVYLSPKKDKSLEFYDSFGRGPTPEVRDSLKQIVQKMTPSPGMLKLKINKIVDQRSNSDSCGYHSARFLCDRMRGKAFPESSGFSRAMEGEKDANKLKDKYESFGYI